MKSKELKFSMQYADTSNAILLFMFLVIAGAILNIAVVSFNGGKMPVLMEKQFQINSPLHFATTTEEGINHPYFIDRFNYKRLYYSVGDVLMFLGLFLSIATTIYRIRLKIKINRYLK